MPPSLKRALSVACAAITTVFTACSLTTDLDGLVRPTEQSNVDAGGQAREFDSGIDATSPDPFVDAAQVPPDAAPLLSPDAGQPDTGQPVDADAGCPSGGVALGGLTSLSPPFGGTGGSPYSDTCPSGSALVGVNVVVGTGLQSLSQIQGLCAPLAYSACSVTVGATTTMSNHGVIGGSPAGLVCPSGSVIVGIRASTSALVDAVNLECAPLVLQTSGTGVTFARGAKTVVGPVGGDGGSPNPLFECPEPMAVHQLGGRSGDWIDQVQLGCGTPSP